MSVLSRILLEFFGPATLPGGRMMVIVDQEPCPSCRERLIAFARKKHIRQIDTYVPERESMVKPGQFVRPKHAARSSFQAGRPETTLRQLPTIFA
jgi:hypothetical protein